DTLRHNASATPSLPGALPVFALFAIVVATSLLIVRRHWRYETWHAVHVIVYIAIALVVPHQFIEGSTFRGKGLAWYFWLLLYVRSEEHTSELQSRENIVCRLL